jgi:hypothetical protein
MQILTEPFLDLNFHKREVRQNVLDIGERSSGYQKQRLNTISYTTLMGLNFGRTTRAEMGVERQYLGMITLLTADSPMVVLSLGYLFPLNTEPEQ